jgi:hypothetical protein
VIDLFIELVEGPAQLGIILGLLGDDLGQAGCKIRLEVRVQTSAVRPPGLVTR